MNVSLTPELEQMVNDKVKSGMYHSASEVIREGLRLLRDQDVLKAAQITQLRNDLGVAINQIESGKFTEYAVDDLGTLADEIKADGRRRLQSREAKRNR